MGAIVDELRKNNVDIDMRTLSHHINYILGRHEKLYGDMAARLSSKELSDGFHKMNVNSFGRAVTMVYLMNIPEEGVRRETVRLGGHGFERHGLYCVYSGTKNPFCNHTHFYIINHTN